MSPSTLTNNVKSIVPSNDCCFNINLRQDKLILQKINQSLLIVLNESIFLGSVTEMDLYCLIIFHFRLNGLEHTYYP